MQLLSKENDQLVERIEKVENERDALDVELRSQRTVLEDISEQNGISIVDEKEQTQMHLALKLSGFTIVPSKIIYTMIMNKKQQLKAEAMFKAKILKENELLSQLKTKNDIIFELKNQVKANRSMNDSMTLSNNQGRL